MEIFTYLYAEMDKLLMPFYRFPDNALAGYFLGTFVLSVICVTAGRYSIALAYRFNKETIKRDNYETGHFHDLSISALKAGDKEAYKACNSIANDAYGKSFFQQIALSASYLWPLFIALGWMQYRFAGVEFSMPLISSSSGYATTFLSCYIITRILSGKIKNKFRHSKTTGVMPSEPEGRPDKITMQLKRMSQC